MGSNAPLFDGLGSQRAMTNSSQTVTGAQNYDAFGNLMGNTSSVTTSLRPTPAKPPTWIGTVKSLPH